MLIKFTIIVALVLGGIAATVALAGPGSSGGYPPPDSEAAPMTSVDDAVPTAGPAYYYDTTDRIEGSISGGY